MLSWPYSGCVSGVGDLICMKYEKDKQKPGGPTKQQRHRRRLEENSPRGKDLALTAILVQAINVATLEFYSLRKSFAASWDSFVAPAVDALGATNRMEGIEMQASSDNLDRSADT